MRRLGCMMAIRLIFGRVLQNPLGTFAMRLPAAFDVNTDNVTIHNVFLGGGFGRRSNPDYSLMAVAIAERV